MTTLGDFIGEIVGDISKARSYADHSSAVLAEKYHADPFTRGLTVPHYVIDEVEIDVPVMVMGVTESRASGENFKEDFLKKTSEEMTFQLYRRIKKQAKEQFDTQNEKNETDANQSEEFFNEESIPKENAVLGEDSTPKNLTAEHIKQYFAISKKVTQKVVGEMKPYLETYNFETLKILDIKDFLCKVTFEWLKKYIQKLDEKTKIDFSDKQLSAICNDVGSWIFFETKKLVSENAGVRVSVETAKIKEYNEGSDSLMKIKVKMKEQDLNVVVEEKGGEETRYISLA
ncbi:MAG: hypothetical protein R3Y32_09200 [Bacillota bacterium]